MFLPRGTDNGKPPCFAAEMERRIRTFITSMGSGELSWYLCNCTEVLGIYGLFSIISNDYIIGRLKCLLALENPKTEIKGKIPFLWPGLGKLAICPFCKTG